MRGTGNNRWPRSASAPPCAAGSGLAARGRPPARFRAGRFTFIIAAAALPPMSSKGWWIGMAVAAAVVYYGTYSFLPFK